MTIDEPDDNEPTLEMSRPPAVEFEAPSPTAARLHPRRRTYSVTCGRAERAELFRSLADALAGDRLDRAALELVEEIDDETLAFLVRALLCGQLSADGRLFLRPEHLASWPASVVEEESSH